MVLVAEGAAVYDTPLEKEDRPELLLLLYCYGMLNGALVVDTSDACTARMV